MNVWDALLLWDVVWVRRMRTGRPIGRPIGRPTEIQVNLL